MRNFRKQDTSAFKEKVEQLGAEMVCVFKLHMVTNKIENIEDHVTATIKFIFIDNKETEVKVSKLMLIHNFNYVHKALIEHLYRFSIENKESTIEELFRILDMYYCSNKYLNIREMQTRILSELHELSFSENTIKFAEEDHTIDTTGYNDKINYILDVDTLLSALGIEKALSLETDNGAIILQPFHKYVQVTMYNEIGMDGRKSDYEEIAFEIVRLTSFQNSLESNTHQLSISLDTDTEILLNREEVDKLITILITAFVTHNGIPC